MKLSEMGYDTQSIIESALETRELRAAMVPRVTDCHVDQLVKQFPLAARKLKAEFESRQNVGNRLVYVSTGTETLPVLWYIVEVGNMGKHTPDPWIVFGRAYGPFHSELERKQHIIEWHDGRAVDRAFGTQFGHVQVDLGWEWDESIPDSGTHGMVEDRVIRWLLEDAKKNPISVEVEPAQSYETAYSEGGDVYCGHCNSGDLQAEVLMDADTDKDGPWLIKCNECGRMNDVREALTSLFGGE